MKKKKIYLASFFIALFLFVLAGCGQFPHFSFMVGGQVQMRRPKWRMPQKRLV